MCEGVRKYFIENKIAINTIRLVEYLKANYKPVDILFDLAQKSSIVLLGGGGFAGPEWSIRISLANLYDEAYSEIGVVLKRILDSYADDWKKLQG